MGAPGVAHVHLGTADPAGRALRLRPVMACALRPARLLAAVALAAAALGAAASTAGAAPPWSASAPVPGLAAETPALAFSAAGVGMLATDTGGGTSPDAVGPHTVGALADDNDAFPGPVFPVTATNFALGDRFALYGLQRIVGLGTHFSRGNDRAGLVFGDVGEKLTDVRFRGPTDRAGVAEALAANARGDVAAAFGVCANNACVHQSIYLVIRRAGSSPLGSIRLDNVAVGQIAAVAINARGDAIVAWQANGGVFARMRTAGGTLYGTERLGNPGEPVRAISAVITADRAAAVAWEAQEVGEGDPESPATVDATFKAAGASHHFHSSQRLATVPALTTGHYVSGRAVKVVLGSDGRIAAAWTAYENGRFVVRTAGLSGFRFTGAQTLSDPTIDAILQDADAGPSGEVGLVWETGVAGHDPGVGPPSLVAAFRAPGAATFGAPETIAPDNADLGMSLRFDPSTGRAVVAWSDLQAMQTSVRPALAAPPAG
jgi:hypothetical protein